MECHPKTYAFTQSPYRKKNGFLMNERQQINKWNTGKF